MLQVHGALSQKLNSLWKQILLHLNTELIETELHSH